MLHACFQILTDYVEEEFLGSTIDYGYHEKFIKELMYLYSWWKAFKQDCQYLFEEGVAQKMLVRLVDIR